MNRIVSKPLKAFALILITGCATDTDVERWEEVTVEQTMEALAAPPGCDGYSCTITGRATGGIGFPSGSVRVSCEGTWVVMEFCWSTQGACAGSAPSPGDDICLDTPPKPDGPQMQRSECTEDPCCIPCEEIGEGGSADENGGASPRQSMSYRRR